MPSGSSFADPAVVVEDLVIRYGDFTAVDRASFTAYKGQVTVVLGPNGAGKTSTIEHLEGFRRAQSGQAKVLGYDPLGDRSKLRDRVGIMLQNGGIPMAIRPIDALRQYAGFFDDPLDPAEVLDRVGLRDQIRTTFRKLSGGQKQRLSLGLAIIGRPEVAFLDEPSAGVDLSGRDAISQIIRELRDDGVCVIVTTHDLHEAESLADRVIIIDRGSVVADGSLDELLAGHSADQVHFSSASTVDEVELTAAIGSPVEVVSPGEYRVTAPGNKTEAIAKIANWCVSHNVELLDVRAGRLRLDDVFRRLTSQDNRPGVASTETPAGMP